MNKEEIDKILTGHAKWLMGDDSGDRADLREANLCGANLYGADLRRADLCGADLREANLCGANLYEANLCGANLYGANLCRADLYGAKSGEEEIIKCNTVLGLKWNILMFQDIVTVGCKKYSLEEWQNFSPDEIEGMDENALDFYPTLISILKLEYKGTKWEFN